MICTATTDIAALSRLLDEALDLDPIAGARWLETLPAEAAHLAPELRALLAPRWSGATEMLLQAPPGRSAEAWHPGQRVGPFVLRRPLGAGGMSEVWMAGHAANANARPVALKLPRLGCMGATQSLVREAALHRRLHHHPHLVPLLDTGSHRGLPWLAFAWVEGVALHQWSRQRPRALRVQAVRQVADTMVNLHARGLVHRDLKPANVLVDPQGCTRLIDFGIGAALATTDPHLHATAPHGFTLGYAAPEQVAGAQPAAAADVYALGVLVAEAWLEPAQVDAVHHELLAEGHDRRAPERLAQRLLRRLAPGPARDLVARAVRPCPAARLQADALASALRAV